MRLLMLTGWLVAAACGSLTAGAAEIPKPTDAPKPRTPEQSAASFTVPDGFRVEVIASEPLISSPTAVCWDERGRMFVGELHGYNLEGQLDIEELNKTGQLDTQVRRVEADEKFKRAARSGTYGVVKMLTSSKHDGHMDTAEVWAKDLPPVYGLIAARGGVIVACTPQIIFLADRHGDGKLAVREVLFEGFKVGEMWRGLNCPLWSADGWICFGQGWPGGEITGPKLAKPVRLPQSDFRIRPDGSAIEPITGASGTFGFAVTSSGDRFVTNTTQPANFVAPLSYHDLMRNPDAVTPSLVARTGDSHAYARAKPHPWRQKRADDPAYFKLYHDAYGAAESEPDGWFTAACGPLVYRDSALPGLMGHYFVCEPALSLVHRSLMEADGSVLTVHRAPGEETSEFMASTDSWCHPINLVHGPDGAIWIVDYYREIIEDYSAIPRHLQQQYGVYRGHDFGRIYRLTHKDLPPPPAADMSGLDVAGLAHEIGSPLLWRRQTAQRLLSERADRAAVAPLRAMVSGRTTSPESLIAALYTLDALGALAAADVSPLFAHAAPAVRIHALHLADARFAGPDGRGLLDAALTAAAVETDARVLIQYALSLGESSEPSALVMLARLAREHLDVRWMDTALISSLHERGSAMLEMLVRDPGKSAPLLPSLARAIAAGRDETVLARSVTALAGAPPDLQVTVLRALVAGRAGAPGVTKADAPVRLALASIAASASEQVRAAARELEDTFVVTTPQVVDLGEPANPGAQTMEVSDATFRSYVAAFASTRDLKRGHEIYLQSCSLCHRIKNEGKEVGPDLLGEIGVAEETTLRSILMPSERIRPGYETTMVSTTTGLTAMGILKEDGATSLTLIGVGGVEQVVLRKDISAVRRLPTSLMPPFGPMLLPTDVANVIAWLRSNLGSGATASAMLFDEETDFAARFDEGDGLATVVSEGAFAGHWCLHITAPQRAASTIKGWNYHIVEKPTAPSEFRYLRLAWRSSGAGVMIELANNGQWPKAEDAAGRYVSGVNTTPWKAHQTSTTVPRSWATVTVDLWKDMGDVHLTGFAPTAIGGEAWFDRIELLRSVAPGEKISAVPAGEKPSDAKPTDNAVPEFTRTVFAAYPLVQHPIAIDVDDHGRVFVAETYRYGQGIVETNENPQRSIDDHQITSVGEHAQQLQRWLDAGELDKDIAAAKVAFSDVGDGRANFLTKYSEKVACLVDRQHTGHADRRTDFAVGFNHSVDGPAAGVLAWDGKVWLTCIPDLWLLEDHTGNQVADTTTSLAHGFGVRSGWLGHDLHGLAWGPDGRLYFSMADRGYNVRTKEGRLLYGPLRGAVFRCWPDGSDLEEYARGLRNPQELAFDDAGNLFTGDNNCDAGDASRIEYIVDGGDYGWEVSYQDLKHRGPWMREHMWEMRFPKEDSTYPAWTIPPVGHLAAGPSGLAAYPGIGLPERYRGHFLLCDFHGGGNGIIHAFKTEPVGAGFSLTDVHAIENGVGASDVTFGYDGRIYVADWGKAWEVNDACRIYTLTHEESQKLPIVAEVQRLAAEGMKDRPTSALCQLLDHVDRRIRLMAQLELSRRPQAVSEVLAAAQSQHAQLCRIHALWTLGMIGRTTSTVLADLLPFLGDEDVEIRSQVVRLLGDARFKPAVPRLIIMLADPSPRVRMMSGLALARLADGSALPALLQLAQDNDDQDAMIRHAVVRAMAACTTPAALLEATRNHPARAVRLAGVLALRIKDAPEVAAFLDDADAQIVTEAARAIYDREITAAMPALAAALDRAVIPSGLRGEGFLRRAIAANLRLGTALAAQRVAIAAALPTDSGMPDGFRLVALEALDTWDAPPQRDGVWSRWEPLPPRAAGLARAAIRAHMPRLISVATGDVLTKAKELDNRFGIEKSATALVALIDDAAQPENLRIEYLTTLNALGQNDEGLTQQTCRRLLGDAASTPHLRVAARATLIARQPHEAFGLLTGALTAGSVIEKQAAVLALGKLSTSEADVTLRALGHQYVDGTLDPVIAVELLETIRSRTSTDAVLARVVSSFEARKSQASDPLGAYGIALDGGDADLGKTVFLSHQVAQCQRCHAVSGHGGSVGPDLVGVAHRHDPEYLLESLILPSAKVVDGYGIVTLILKDGTSLGGVLQKKTAESVTILEGAKSRVISAGDILSMSAPMSAMPPMGGILSPRELRDVLAYLRILQ